MKKKDYKNGMALISVLLLLILLVMIGVSMVFISTNHLRMMGNVEAYDMALKAAEAGAEYVLAKLNEDTRWGNPDTPPVQKRLDNGSTYSINFDPAYDYYSYNNLCNNTDYTRAPGEILQGTVPKYTFEVISQGQAPSGATKILRVIYIRDDAIPGNVIANGRISLNMGIISFHGYEPNTPGWIYSKWDGEAITTDARGRVDAKGGILSARGSINVNPYPDASSVSIDEYAEKNIQGADIDVDGFIGDKASSVPHVNTCYAVSTIQGIKNDEDCIGAAIEAIYTGGDGELLTMMDPTGYYPSALPGNPHSGDIARIHTGFIAGSLHITGGVGLSESWVSADKGAGVTSWFGLKVSKITGTETYNEYVAVPEDDDDDDDDGDDDDDDDNQWAPSTSGTVVREFNATSEAFDIRNGGYHWGGSLPSNWKAEWMEMETVIVKCSFDDLKDPQWFPTDADYAAGNVDFPGGAPLDYFTLVKNPDQSCYVRLDSDIYTAIGDPDDTSVIFDDNVNAFAIKKVYNIASRVAMNSVKNTYLDMNGYDIYSGGNTAIAMELRNGSDEQVIIASGGKLGYLYGYDIQNILSLSDGNLYLPTSYEIDNYTLGGYIYSQGSLTIGSMNDSAPALKSKAFYTTEGGNVEIIDSCRIYDGDIDYNDVTLNCREVLYVKAGGTYIIRPLRSNAEGKSKIGSGLIDESGFITYVPTAPNPTISYKKFNLTGELVDCAYNSIISGSTQEAFEANLDILYKNYINKHITLEGRIVANNKNEEDDAVYIKPGEEESTFESLENVGDLSALVSARSNNFKVMRICWEIIK